MLMLAKIYSLLFKDEACYKSEAYKIKNKVAVLYLASNITSSGARQIPLIQRVLSVTGLTKVDSLLSTYAQFMVEDFLARVNTSPITLS